MAEKPALSLRLDWKALVWIVGLIFVAGGIYWRIDYLEKRMDDRMDRIDRDLQHALWGLGWGEGPRRGDTE